MTVSAWAPLRRSAFRALWLAQFASNIGTWAQTVGAQWLMGDLGGSALQVALVQTATTLPVFLLVVPSGALGDILDRRHVLISGQALMLAGAAGLMLLAGTDRATPTSLLGLLALMAIGLMAGYRFLMAVMMLLAVTTLYTVLQRIRHVHRVATGADSTARRTPGHERPVDTRDAM